MPLKIFLLKLQKRFALIMNKSIFTIILNISAYHFIKIYRYLFYLTIKKIFIIK